VSKKPINEGDFHGFLPVAVNSNKIKENGKRKSGNL